MQTPPNLAPPEVAARTMAQDYGLTWITLFARRRARLHKADPNLGPYWRAVLAELTQDATQPQPTGIQEDLF